MPKKTSKKTTALDPYLQFLVQANKTLKKTYKNKFDMAPSIASLQKASGIHHSSSDTWQLKSKKNPYKIKTDYNLNWNPIKPQIQLNTLETLSFNNIKNKMNISDSFPKQDKGNELIIQNGNFKLKIFFKKTALHKMNKGVTPAGTEGRCNKNGEATKKWCKLAIFEETYIKINNDIYLRIRRDNTKPIPNEVVNREKNGKIRFHFGIGYCKLETDSQYIYPVLALSPEYINQTCFDVLTNKRLNNNHIDLSINIKSIQSNNIIQLYSTKQIINEPIIYKKIYNIEYNESIKDTRNKPLILNNIINNEMEDIDLKINELIKKKSIGFKRKLYEMLLNYNNLFENNNNNNNINLNNNCNFNMKFNEFPEIEDENDMFNDNMFESEMIPMELPNILECPDIIQENNQLFDDIYIEPPNKRQRLDNTLW